MHHVRDVLLKALLPDGLFGKHNFVFDRDPAFSTDVVTVLRSIGIKPTRTAFRSQADQDRLPQSLARRRGGAVRRHASPQTARPHHVVNDRHLARQMREFVA
jgi:hypothetical protein